MKLTQRQIEERLAELAEIEYVPLKKTELKEAMKPEFDDDGEPISCVASQIIQNGCNITHSKQLKKIRTQEKPCPDCNKMCVNRTVSMRLETGNRRDQCDICGLGRNPWSGKFEVLPEHFYSVSTAYEIEHGSTRHKFKPSSKFIKSYRTK